MPRSSRLDDYDNCRNSDRQSDWDAKWAKDAREPVVALVRVVRDEDRREMLALNFQSAFTAEVGK